VLIEADAASFLVPSEWNIDGFNRSVNAADLFLPDCDRTACHQEFGTKRPFGELGPITPPKAAGAKPTFRSPVKHNRADPNPALLSRLPSLVGILANLSYKNKMRLQLHLWSGAAYQAHLFCLHFFSWQ
jgi:hypothetical protein